MLVGGCWAAGFFGIGGGFLLVFMLSGLMFPLSNIPTGLRYQLLCALRGLASGEPMLVRQLPPATDAASARAVQQPRSPAPEGHHQLEILSVPGTHYPDLIGHLLIAAGCCAPSPHAHWVASLTAFQLTETGYSYYCKLQDWWSTQPWTVRLALRLKE